MPIIHSASEKVRRRGAAIAVAAIVVTAIVTFVVVSVPVALMLAGLNMHAASDGSPAQASVIVPLKFVELTTAIEEVPVPPGAEITTCEPFDAVVA